MFLYPSGIFYRLFSYSNEICELTTSPSVPAYHYLTTASHLLGDKIEVELYTDTLAQVQSYDIERKGPNDIDYSVVSSLSPNGTSFYNFTDTDVFANRGSYSYRANIIDTCGNKGTVSNFGNTMFLSIRTDNEFLINTLSWTDYFEFDGSIESYNIYRGVDGAYDPIPIATITSGVRSYEDDLSGAFFSEGRFCYRVEAVESKNTYNFSRTSFSNEVCIVFEPVVFIPNTIVIGGHNNTFLPVVNLYVYSSYQLQIFDRWGGSIFVTENRSFGWDGVHLFTGGLVKEGVYVYLLTFNDGDGKRFEHKGTVNLMYGGK